VDLFKCFSSPEFSIKNIEFPLICCFDVNFDFLFILDNLFIELFLFKLSESVSVIKDVLFSVAEFESKNVSLG